MYRLLRFLPTYRRSAFDSADLLRQDPGRDVIRTIPFSSSLGRLIVVQTAITLVLLIGAALLIETLQHLWAVPLGFQPEHVVAFIADYPQARYASDKERLALARQRMPPPAVARLFCLLKLLQPVRTINTDKI
jgi:hypothetical protein